MPSLEDDGDLFERKYWDWINERLPAYEEIWSVYIGNDGKSAPKPQVTIPDAWDRRWRLFYQFHYSLALYARLFDEHAWTAIAHAKANKSTVAHDAREYVRTVKHFSFYVALLGQVCDAVKNIGLALEDCGEMAKAIEEFANQRNNAIHAAKIPMATNYMGLLIAHIAGKAPEDINDWGEKVTWDVVDRTKFKILQTWLAETRDCLFATLKDTVYPIMRKTLAKRFSAPAAIQLVVNPAHHARPKALVRRRHREVASMFARPGSRKRRL